MADGPYPELSERKPETCISTTLHPLRHLKGLSLFKGTQTPYRSYHTITRANSPQPAIPRHIQDSRQTAKKVCILRIFAARHFQWPEGGKAEAGKFRRPDPRQTFADLLGAIHLRGEMRVSAQMAEGRFPFTSTSAKQRKYGRNKTVKLLSAGQRTSDANSNAPTKCDLPALGVNSSRGVQFLSRELNAACPYLAPIQTAFLQYARMGAPTETIGAPFQSRKPSHSGKFRKSAMRETKNASPAGGIPV